jgi:hypothetical protein
VDFRDGLLYILEKEKISFRYHGSEVCSLIKRAMISQCPDELSNVSYSTVNSGL